MDHGPPGIGAQCVRELPMKRGITVLILVLVLFLGIPCSYAGSQEGTTVLGKDHTLYVQFQDFAASRILTLNRNFLHRPDNVSITVGNPHFTGRYFSIDPSTTTIEVKLTGSRLTPYIGVLTYIESIYECRGPSRISASKGPFYPVSHRKVTEIFRYNHNRWQ